MARGMGKPGSGHPVYNELQPNGEPPQSTLAAQLVNHFTDGKKHSRNQDQETFRQLLREILNADRQENSRGEANETDSDVNYKLIYVIVKAGLDILNADDPFDEKSELLRQATDSLAAIELTIRRSPEILFIVPSRQDPNPKSSGPLYLWLVPQLLGLAGHARDDGVGDGILRLLTTALLAEGKTHTKGGKMHSIFKYVKGCIKG